MTDYVKVHGEGNPSYESTKWSQSCTPLLARREEWERFLPECSIDDLASRRCKFYSKIG